MGKIIEGVWDCKYCDGKKIAGSIYTCPNCGRQRDNNVRFYIDNPKNYLSQEDAAKLNKNPDWLCGFCDGLNSDDNKVCYNCGAPRDKDSLTYFENKKKQEEIEKQRQLDRQNANDSYSIGDRKRIWDTLEEIDEEIEKFRLQMEHQPIQNNDAEIICEDHYSDYESSIQSEKNRFRQVVKRFAFSSIAILLLFAMIGGIIFLCMPKVRDVTVDSFSWERSISIEEYKTIEEDGWTLPSGGRLLYSKREIRSYKQVIDHYETKSRTYTEQVLDHYETRVVGHRDLGNGRFEEITSRVPVYRTETKTETYREPVYRSEPVYDTKYYYEIDKWVHKETLKTSGNDKSPYWNTLSLKKNERESGRKEEYSINVLNKDGKVKKYILDYDDWNSLSVGQTIKLKTFVGGRGELILD